MGAQIRRRFDRQGIFLNIPLYRRTGKREQAQQHLTTATTMVPIYRDSSRSLIKVRIGLTLYDWLTPGRHERYRVLKAVGTPGRHDDSTFSRQRRLGAVNSCARPAGIKQLKGPEKFLRLRAGDYRAIYLIEGKNLVVLIVRIGDRKDVYEGLETLTRRVQAWKKPETRWSS